MSNPNIDKLVRMKLINALKKRGSGLSGGKKGAKKGAKKEAKKKRCGKVQNNYIEYVKMYKGKKKNERPPYNKCINYSSKMCGSMEKPDIILEKPVLPKMPRPVFPKEQKFPKLEMAPEEYPPKDIVRIHQKMEAEHMEDLSQQQREQIAHGQQNFFFN